jgi:hypothetical protein
MVLLATVCDPIAWTGFEKSLGCLGERIAVAS